MTDATVPQLSSKKKKVKNDFGVMETTCAKAMVAAAWAQGITLKPAIGARKDKTELSLMTSPKKPNGFTQALFCQINCSIKLSVTFL